jgi:hypothetical protein
MGKYAFFCHLICEFKLTIGIKGKSNGNDMQYLDFVLMVQAKERQEVLSKPDQARMHREEDHGNSK